MFRPIDCQRHQETEIQIWEDLRLPLFTPETNTDPYNMVLTEDQYEP